VQGSKRLGLELLKRLADRRPDIAIVEKSYRGAQVQEVLIVRSGQRCNMTRTIRVMIKHRNAIEPTIDHMKMDGKLARNLLKGMLGGALYLVFCCTDHNLRLSINKLKNY
jgi:IS5 family transposase